MKNSTRIDFKDRVNELENGGRLLEAFLIQSAHVESLLRRLFNYQLSLAIHSRGIRKAIKGKTQHLSSVLRFAIDSEWLLKEEYDDAITYFNERNLIVHDLVASSARDLDERLGRLLVQGKSILKDHGSLDGFVKVAQIEHSRGEMRATKETFDLTSREKEIFGLRLSGKTLEEVGGMFGVTRERVRQIQNRAIQKMEGLVSVSVVRTEKTTKLQLETHKSVDVFIMNVCKDQGITWSDLRGKSRKAELVFVRHWIAYTLRERFKLSFPVIGKKLSRDHTTIIHAHNRITTLIKEGRATA